VSKFSRCEIFFVCACLSLPVVAQQFPQPTAQQQVGIDKDASRHFGDAPTNGGPKAVGLSPALKPVEVDKAIRKVADWQLRTAQPYFDRIWTWSVLYSGFMAASNATGDAKYRNAMMAMGQKFEWQLRNRLPNADDQSVGQTYLELYRLTKDPGMIAPMRADMDAVIDLPTLSARDNRIPWWWCDALFMAPPAWARMYAATGDRKYINYLDAQWQRTSDLLYDKQEHLYARDATYLTKTESNGKKVFWSRGNGWVMGGLVRTLEFLPKDDPKREFYIAQLREMSMRVASLQGSDGLWHAGLLDPQHYPLPEISGSALFTYAMAWGVNHGILDKKIYRPIIQKAWRGMLKQIYADGRLGCIQQTGAEPAFYLPTASYNYGVGAFLLAGEEVKVLAGGIRTIYPQAVEPLPPPALAPTDPTLNAHLNLPVPANAALPTLFLVGDSTVRNGKGDGANGQWGWGEPLSAYFDSTRLNVVNRAIGGRSSRTYITEGHWDEVLALLKPGDVVLLQFGHNDSGPLDDTARARGTIPGVGDETREIENPILKKHEIVHSYGWYMTRYVLDARAEGTIPILCSPIPRKTWKDGKIVRNEANYGGWARKVAEAQRTGFIDLDEIIARQYDALGEANVEPLFADPHTHTSLAGAQLNAESVVAGLKALSPDPVAHDFSTKGAAVQATHVHP
jgi:unsaturated rhamnogalacturonyl hydrolase